MMLKLDLQFFAGEKTEKATPKKRQETRKKGQTAKSQDVNTAVSLLLIFSFLLFYFPLMGGKILDVFRHSLTNFIGIKINESNTPLIMMDVLKEVALFILPILLIALIAGVVANLMQVGFLFTTEPLQPKLEKIDPIKGLKRIFSVRALVELLKSMMKIGFVGMVSFSVLWMNFDQVLILSHKTISEIIVIIGKLSLQIGIAASIALLFLSLLDYLYQRYDYEKNIRMSKQDMKDEFKNSEGDPLIKSKIKQRQREMAMSRMMQEVPKADVIITNPTHFAIALKYEENNTDAPIVIAKGVDFIAQKIKIIAKEHQIITVENRPLARSLYDQVEVGQEIPDEFFKAVAEIIAYVYRIKNKV